MTTYEYEVICKNAIIDWLKEKNINRKISDLHTIWFAKTLSNIKCIIAKNLETKAPLIYEFTYIAHKKEILIDCYKKVNKRVVNEKFFRTKVDF